MNQPELLKWLTEEQQKWDLLIAAIGEQRMDQTVVNGNWSMRDIVAHLTGWQRWLILRLQAAVNGQAQPTPAWPANFTPDDDINAWIYESNRNRPVRQVLDEVQELHEQLLAIVQGLPQNCRIETIESKFHVIWVDGKRFEVSEFYNHFYDDHAADVRTWLERGA